MSGYIKRDAERPVSVAIAASGTTSDAIDVRNFASGQLIMPGTITSTALTIHVCDTQNGTFVPLYKDDGTTAVGIGSIYASRAYQLPPEALGGHWIKIVMGSAEGAARTLMLLLKG